MTNERLFRDLARVAREDDERTAVVAHARDEAASTSDSEEDFVREVLARGDDERLVGAALAAVAPAAREEGQATPAARAPRASAPAVVGRPRARWLPAAASALALAAGLVLFLRSRGDADALPPYEAVLSGADSADRANPSRGTVVTHGASLVLVAQPRESVTGPLEARAFAGCGGAMAPIDATITVAPTGAARLEGTPASLFGPGAEGPCALALAVGRPGSLPERLDDGARANAVVRVDLVVRRP